MQQSSLVNLFLQNLAHPSDDPWISFNNIDDAGWPHETPRSKALTSVLSPITVEKAFGVPEIFARYVPSTERM